MTEVVPQSVGHVPPPQEPLAVPAPSRTREFLAWVSLASLVAGLVGLALGSSVPRMVGLFVFCVVGIGSAPWQLNARLSLISRLLLSALTSFVAWTLPSALMASIGAWHPALVFAGLAAVSAPLHLFALGRILASRRSNLLVPAGERLAGPSPGTEPDTASPRRRRGPVWLAAPWVLAAGGLGLSLYAALTHRYIDPGFGGYSAKIGVLWYVGLALLLLALVLCSPRSEWQAGTVVTLIMLVLVLTPALVYAGPASQSAFKHVDLVQQIRRTGHLDAAVPIYTAWPGYFSSMAWLCDVTGLRDSLAFAVFWPPFIGFFRVLALRGLAGRFITDPFRCWTAVALALLADSIKADYFSPQSAGYVLALLIVGIALSKDVGHARLPMLFIGGFTLTLTHQLSPFIAGGVLVVLVLFRQLRPWWSPLLVLVPAVAWTLTHFDAVKHFLAIGSLGQLSNFRPPRTVAVAGLTRSPVVTETVVALVAGVCALVFLALVSFLRNLRDLRAWAVIAAPGVGLLLIATNPYGQEGIFRATLFGIPWLAVLAARLFPGARVPRARAFLTRVALLEVLLALSAAYLVSTTGLDNINQTRPADVAALRYAHAQSPGNYALFRLGPGDVPTSLRPGEYSFNDADLGLSEAELASLPPAVQVQRITAAYMKMISSSPPVDWPDLYAFYSPVEAQYASAYGLERPRELEALRNAFSESPYWHVIFQDDGTVLFRLDPHLYLALQR